MFVDGVLQGELSCDPESSFPRATLQDIADIDPCIRVSYAGVCETEICVGCLEDDSSPQRYMYGPGDKLHNTLKSYGIVPTKDCGCDQKIQEMNQLGVQGCLDQIDDITEHIRNKSRKRYLVAPPKFVVKKLIKKSVSDFKFSYLPDNGNWFVGLTTAPRKSPTLEICTESILRAGWTPTIFAEPGVDLTGYNIPVIRNEERLGVWRNWIKLVEHALATDAEYILTVQDDAFFHPETREFTEAILWPDENAGFVSLYTAKHYSFHWRRKNQYDPNNLKPVGVNRCNTKSLWGAMALVFHRHTLELMLEMPFIQNWAGARSKSPSKTEQVRAKRRAEPWTIQNSDTAIGQALRRMKRDLYFVDPSPVQHISEYSSIRHGSNKGKRNCYRCATHNISLFNQVPINFTPTELKW